MEMENVLVVVILWSLGLVAFRRALSWRRNPRAEWIIKYLNVKVPFPGLPSCLGLLHVYLASILEKTGRCSRSGVDACSGSALKSMPSHLSTP